jgi:hypothetical protein
MRCFAPLSLPGTTVTAVTIADAISESAAAAAGANTAPTANTHAAPKRVKRHPR